MIFIVITRAYVDPAFSITGKADFIITMNTRSLAVAEIITTIYDGSLASTLFTFDIKIIHRPSDFLNVFADFLESCRLIVLVQVNKV